MAALHLVLVLLEGIAGYAYATACIGAVFYALEVLWPRKGAVISNRSRFKALGFWLIYIPCVMLTSQLLWTLWAPLGVKPLLAQIAPSGLPRPIAAVIAAVAAAFVGDFIYYWYHRLQHRFFWRFHAVHHSVREMSGISAFHHVSEPLFRFVLYTAPLAFITQDPFGVPILGWLVALQGYYEHSPTRLNFGPLGRYIVDNRFHRIHHSIETEHYDKNFGVIVTLWDSLFGTAYFPSKDEWPQTGVQDFPEPGGIRDYLLGAFTYRPGQVEDPHVPAEPVAAAGLRLPLDANTSQTA
jgi:sterol desaturase/sphingolipid hydroxylase (fatty acid hydroxylase superfamily)